MKLWITNAKKKKKSCNFQPRKRVQGGEKKKKCGHGLTHGNPKGPLTLGRNQQKKGKCSKVEGDRGRPPPTSLSKRAKMKKSVKRVRGQVFIEEKKKKEKLLSTIHKKGSWLLLRKNGVPQGRGGGKDSLHTIKKREKKKEVPVFGAMRSERVVPEKKTQSKTSNLYQGPNNTKMGGE